MRALSRPRAPVARALALATLPVLLAPTAPSSQNGRPDDAVTVQVLAFNDFHGHLEPPAGSTGLIGQTPAGGAEYLATHLKRALRDHPDSIVVAAGDLVGASPFVSAMFHDEPAIESLSAMGLAVASVGNHEFDDGWRELLRLQRGGCHPVDGCQDGDGFEGARFSYLSANVLGPASGTLLPATSVRTVAGVSIGFIGETLRQTPRIVRASGVEGLQFLDEASAANAHAAQLRRQGVHAIVLLVHQGGAQAGRPDPDGCNDLRGPIVPLVARLSPDIKVVVSGHSHQFYNCLIDGRRVTSASSYGRMMTRLNLSIARSTGEIRSVTARNEIVTRDVPKDSEQTRLVEKYVRLAAPHANRVVGVVSRTVARRSNAAGESALGDLIADAQLAAARPASRGGAQVAFVNTGGIRTDLTRRTRPGRPIGTVTYADLFEVQPFGNTLGVVTLTGDAIKRLLEQQFTPNGDASVLQVSDGFSYRYTSKAPAGQHVDAGTITLSGVPISPASRVRVAANDFLLGGGDGFSVFQEGLDRVDGDSDIAALTAYVEQHSPIALSRPQNRIIRVD
jgi:5'-nucleotidase